MVGFFPAGRVKIAENKKAPVVSRGCGGVSLTLRVVSVDADFPAFRNGQKHRTVRRPRLNDFTSCEERLTAAAVRHSAGFPAQPADLTLCQLYSVPRFSVHDERV